jgi:hypothetical protein
MNTRIAVWSLSGTQSDTWRIHSSLVLPENHTVTTLDCNAGNNLGASRDMPSSFRIRFTGRWQPGRFIRLHSHIRERPPDLVPKVDAPVRLCVPFQSIHPNRFHSVNTPSRARFAPSMMFIATTSVVRPSTSTKPHPLTNHLTGRPSR